MFQSEALREQLYSSPWYICDKKHRQLVFMVLMRSSRPVRISVAKLYDLSHATFIMVGNKEILAILYCTFIM